MVAGQGRRFAVVGGERGARYPRHAMEPLPKPRELLAARASAEVLFGVLREWFGVPPHLMLDLVAIDSAVTELQDPTTAAAMTMRRLQALHVLTTPGVRTTTDVVLTLLQEIERSLLRAPGARLRSEVAGTDWDAELAALEEGEQPLPPGAGEGGEAFDDLEHFRRHHAALRAAARAVIAASEGSVRVLI